MDLTQLSVLEQVLGGVFIFTVLVQLGYYWGLFSRLAFFKPDKKPETEKPSVSVVMAARNEYYNLNRNLPSILEQDYHDFEVVVVNHASEDETGLLLKELQGKYPHLKVVELKQDLNFFKGKKFPLSIGIREAKNEVLILTDADCKPASDQWIKKMAGNYSDKQTEVVLGYGPYQKEKGFVNLLVRYDTFMVALQYLSMALAGKPYMGVGRNLSYKKSLFYQTKGFISHYNIPSGDDDLFISQVAKKENTAVELSKESFVYSVPKRSFGEWFKQKKRHLQTSAKYKPLVKFLLGWFSLSQLMFFLFFAGLLITGSELLLWVALSGFSLRLISQVIIHKKVANTLDEGKLCVFSLLWEPIHLLLMAGVMLVSRFSGKKTW